MKKAPYIIASSVALAFSAHAATTLYHFEFETSDPTVFTGSGAGTPTANGTITSTVGGATGNFGSFDGGNVAGSDSIDLSLAADSISLGNFSITVAVNDSAAIDYDDFIGFSSSGGNNFVLERQGGALEANNRMTFNDLGVIGVPSSIGDLAEGSWTTFSVVGTTSGADAEIEFFTGATSNGSLTITGGASQTLTNFRIGGRVGANNRYVEGGIDDVMIINTVPEPSSAALLGLGGLALSLRRRK